MVVAGIVILIVAVVWAGAVLYLRRVWFYRDPARTAPTGEGLLISPADGQVVYIKRFEDNRIFAEKLGRAIAIDEIVKLGERLGPHPDSGWMIGVYMSPLDVHFNYAPAEGEIAAMVHTQTGVNLPMVDLWEYVRLTWLRRAVDLFAARYHLINERNTVVIRSPKALLAVVEIADKFVNKITTFVQTGERLVRGQKLSFIERGSQADLVIFSDDVEFLVTVGQQVYGGLTPIARLK